MSAINYPVEAAVPVYRQRPDDAEGIYSMIESYVLDEIYNEIESLSGPCKAVFELTFFHGLDAAGVAERLNISVNAVLQYKQQALAALRFTVLKRCLS